MIASIVIRVKNEEQNLKKLFSILKTQINQDFEIIIVDDSSIDNSARIAFDFFPEKRIKIIKVPGGKFTYPFASNLGAKQAKGKFLVYLSAHSYPISNTWLSEGLSHFTDPKVGGVFGYPQAHQDANIYEKLWYNIGTLGFLPKHKRYTKYRSGVMGTTNAIIPKRLWVKHNFDEKWGKGGEDIEWSVYYMNKGYVMVQDFNFRTYHSHHLGVIGLFKQMLRYQTFREAQKTKEVLRLDRGLSN